MNVWISLHRLLTECLLNRKISFIIFGEMPILTLEISMDKFFEAWLIVSTHNLQCFLWIWLVLLFELLLWYRLRDSNYIVRKYKILSIYVFCLCPCTLLLWIKYKFFISFWTVRLLSIFFPNSSVEKLALTHKFCIRIDFVSYGLIKNSLLR